MSKYCNVFRWNSILIGTSWTTNKRNKKMAQFQETDKATQMIQLG